MTTARLMTTTAALALYDAAANDSDRLVAAAHMADAIRCAPPKKRAVTAAPVSSPQLTGSALLAALARLKGVVEVNASIPILSNVAVKSASGRLTLTATDLDMQWQETLSAEGLPAFQVTVPFADLAGAMRGQKGDVQIRLDGPQLIVTAGGVEARLPTLPWKDFPFMAPCESYVSAILPAERISGPLGFIQHAISTEETRYYLNGAYMHTTPHEGVPRLTFVATDGHRLAMERGEDDGELGAAPAVILPRKLVAWLVAHLGAGEVVVEVCAQGVRFITDTGDMTAKLIDGSFPDYMRCVPRDQGIALVRIDDAKAVSETIGRLAATSKERSRSIRLEISPAGVTADVRNMEGGKSTATLPATGAAGAKCETGFNSNYVRAILAHGGPIEMFIGEGGGPSRVEWPEHPNRLAVLMPLRV